MMHNKFLSSLKQASLGLNTETETMLWSISVIPVVVVLVLWKSFWNLL